MAGDIKIAFEKTPGSKWLSKYHSSFKILE